MFAALLILTVIGCKDASRPTPKVSSPVISTATADQTRALKDLHESIKLLALIQSDRLHEAQPTQIESRRLEVIRSIWAMGAYERNIDDLDGPRAIDVAYLLLNTISCHTEDDIPHYYAIVQEEFNAIPEGIKPQLEIREFLQRALAKRKKPELLPLE